MSAAPSIEAQRYQAHAFLSAVFAAKPESTVVVACQEGRWGAPTGLLSIGPVVERVAGQPDYYVGTCPLRRKPGKGSRGTAAEAAFLPGAWIDVDVNGSPIRGKAETVTGHAPDRIEALEAIHAIARPTLIVNSGYGYQPWFLLDRGLVLHDAGEQRRAERVVHGLQRRLEHDAGWKVDAKHDLACVLRIPGTLNTKAAEPAPVTLLSPDGPRYTVEQLEELAGDHLAEVSAPREPVPPEAWAQRIHDGVDAGDRHERIWQLAGYLLRRDLDPAVAYELVSAFNDARVRPSYDEPTVRKHFDGILRRELDRRREQPRWAS